MATWIGAVQPGGRWIGAVPGASGAAPASSAGSAAGTSTATGVGGSLAASAGTSAGTSTASGVGRALAASAGISAGTSAAPGTGAAAAPSAGTSAGTSTSPGVGGSTASAPGTAAGSSASAAAGSSLAASAGAAAGSSTAPGVGASASAGSATGTASGSSTATGVGSATARSAGTSAGTSSAPGTGSSLAASAGTAAGTSTAAGSAGTSTAATIRLALGRRLLLLLGSRAAASTPAPVDWSDPDSDPGGADERDVLLDVVARLAALRLFDAVSLAEDDDSEPAPEDWYAHAVVSPGGGRDDDLAMSGPRHDVIRTGTYAVAVHVVASGSRDRQARLSKLVAACLGALSHVSLAGATLPAFTTIARDARAPGRVPSGTATLAGQYQFLVTSDDFESAYD